MSLCLLEGGNPELPRGCLGGARSHPPYSGGHSPTGDQGHQPLIIVHRCCQARGPPGGATQIHLTFKGPGWWPQGGELKPSPVGTSCHRPLLHKSQSRRRESLKQGGSASYDPSSIRQTGGAPAAAGNPGRVSKEDKGQGMMSAPATQPICLTSPRGCCAPERQAYPAKGASGRGSPGLRGTGGA